jgi:hypothetical protein
MEKEIFLIYVPARALAGQSKSNNVIISGAGALS